MKHLLILLLFSCGTYRSVFSQQILLLEEGQKTSLRGLSVVDDQVLWVSGSNGRVARSRDGGRSFMWLTVAGYENRDFRDIQAFDSLTAIIMAISEPAVMLKTRDGGRNWYRVFVDSTKGMFLDAMDFLEDEGVVVGDPINNKPFIATTADQGESWTVTQDKADCFNVEKGEAFFAASGSNVVLKRPTGLYQRFMVSGGSQSRLFIDQSCYTIPLQSGRSSTGANGLLLLPKTRTGVIVGGDFSNDKRTDSTLVFFRYDNKLTFRMPAAMPNGYKSGAAFTAGKKLILCGTSGVDLGDRKGKHWKNISTVSFHAVKASPDGKVVFFGRLKWKDCQVHTLSNPARYKVLTGLLSQNSSKSSSPAFSYVSLISCRPSSRV